MTTILNEITKEVFERYVPAARMPERSTSVFNRLEASLQTAYYFLLKNVVSHEFENKITENEQLKNLCIKVVCIDAFVRTCRSLDLVLTGTGFGIVSTGDTAPASKARVDALVEQMTIEEIETIDDIVIDHLTQVEGWGLTEQARTRIPTVFFRFSQLRQTSLSLTTQDWAKAKAAALSADALLRREISDEYMDELLLKLRTKSGSHDNMLFTLQKFIYTFISEGVPNKFQLQQIVDKLESNIERYPTYKASKLYAKRHAERYQNKREDPTFFCM